MLDVLVGSFGIDGWTNDRADNAQMETGFWAMAGGSH